ncbi:MAG: ATP-binding cassette domain-containing protein [Myxococcales bacterium]|nr:ATP-binding cassette domain-containing protein [Myxococcales bacterium]
MRTSPEVPAHDAPDGGAADAWRLDEGLRSGVGAPDRLVRDEVLRLEDVSLLRQGRSVVDRICFSMGPGELLMLCGGRGAGKSTLMAIAASACRPNAGRVLIAGRDILGLQAGSLPFVRRNIGYLPPEPPLVLDETACENVMLALAVRGASPPQAEEGARKALREIGVCDEAVQSPVAELSWGERRLVAVARALVGAPPLVVLDEPAAGLSEADREALARGIDGARAAGAAVLCATADPAFASQLARRGARTLALEAGRLVGAPRMTLLRGERPGPAPAEGAPEGVGAAAPGFAPEVPDVKRDDVTELHDDDLAPWSGDDAGERTR